MLPSKRPLYMRNILNVAPKIGNINVLTLIMVRKVSKYIWISKKWKCVDSFEMVKLHIHVTYPQRIIFAYTSCIWMVWFHFIVSFLITQVIYQSFKILNDYFKIEFVSRVRKVSSKDWKVSNFLLQKVLVEAFQSLLLLSHRNEIWSCPTFLSV